MKKIPLTKGQFAIVDDEDYEELSKYKWFANWSKTTKSFYAKRVIQMGRQIMSTPSGFVCDHKNHNTLDYRRENLRNVTQRQNTENKSNQSKHGSGVQFQPGCKPNKQFQAQVRIKNVRHCLGGFASPEEAQTARNEFLADPAAYQRRYPSKRNIYGGGVSKNGRSLTRPFVARLVIKGKRFHLGYFATIEEAQAAKRKFLADPQSYENPNRRKYSPYGAGVRRLSKSFSVRAYAKGQEFHLGHFATLEEAQAARKKFLEGIP